MTTKKKKILMVILILIIPIGSFFCYKEATRYLDKEGMKALRAELKESAWTRENGKSTEVIVFNSAGNIMIGKEPQDDYLEGEWGNYEVVSPHEIKVINGTQGSLNGRHEVSIGNEKLVFDGNVYQESDIEVWHAKINAAFL